MHSKSQSEAIAVVGSACRFPGKSKSPAELWNLLKDPHDVSCEIPDERFELKGYYHPKGTYHGATNVTRAYMIEEDVHKFDASFFNISPNEAVAMDPQQRLLLEVVYEALDSGGHSIDYLRGSDTSVYVGTMSVDYNDVILRDMDSMPTYASTGTSRAILSNRISYFFDWHGPSMTIDTACSSSMVALHQGVQSLRSGEAHVAVVGGTELLLGPEQFVSESKMTLLSPNGQSRMWDANANGYARGDGVASLVLKTLTQAIADRDHIECLIRETGVNHDGKSNGLTVPSSEAQESLIRSTYARAGLDISNPRDWPQYFEAHGTGTKAGDPREAAAISASFQGRQIHGGPLFVGSIKTIIGHTEGTAGLAGVIKASLCLQNQQIPPNMLLNRLNPDIEKYYDGLLVPSKTAVKWPSLPAGVPRRASVNSFGYGGTNGHAILEGYEPSDPELVIDETERNEFMSTPLTLSASSDISLRTLIASYAEYLEVQIDRLDLRDLGWTLQSRRSALPYRAAFSAKSKEELPTQLREASKESGQKVDSEIGARVTTGTRHCLGVFTGQGAQWPGMGGILIRKSAFVRQRLAQLDESLCTLPKEDRPSWKLADQLSAGKDISRIGEAALSQPLCTAVQVVLVDLLKSAGITFSDVVGHSSGEIAAAYAADFISGEDAIRIAYYRGVHAKLAHGQDGKRGSMLAVSTTWEDANDLLSLPVFKGRVAIGCHNSSTSLTLSGDLDALAHVKRVFDEDKKFTRQLRVDTAYHSHHMIPCGDPYVASLRACRIAVKRNRNTLCTWYSSVKPGAMVTPGEDLQASYWRDNMVNAVLFAEAVKSAVNDSHNLVVELGPHPALKGPALQNIGEVRTVAPSYGATLQRNMDDVQAISSTLGFAWSRVSDPVDFQAFEDLAFPRSRSPRIVMGLPSYAWNHDKDYWHETRRSKQKRVRGAAIHALLGTPSSSNTERELRWTNLLKAAEIPWLDGHQLEGQVVFPAAGYVAMALEASEKLAGDRSIRLLEMQDLVISRALAFDNSPDFAIETLVTLTGIDSRADSQDGRFALYACSNTQSGGLDFVAGAHVKVIYGEPTFGTLSSCPPEQSNMTPIHRDLVYGMLDDIGYGYSGSFRTMSATSRRQGQAFATISTYDYSDEEDIFVVHPTYLDVAIQTCFLAQSSPGDEQLWSLHVPTSIGRIRVNPALCASLPNSSVELPVYAKVHKSQDHEIRSSFDIFGDDGQHSMVQVEHLVMKPFSPALASNDRPMFSTVQFVSSLPMVENCLEDFSVPVRNPETSSGSLNVSADYSWLQNHSSGVLKSITQRFPHMNIFELGIDESPAPMTALEILHGAFDTYTYANGPQKNVEEVMGCVDDGVGKIVLKIFDVTNTPSSQGLSEYDYDVVVATLASQSLSDLRQVLTNLRKLLKPGGYLIVCELLTSGLPKELDWTKLLKEANFSGVDSHAMNDTKSRVMVTQAVDSRINLLRNPLSENSLRNLGDLVILGGCIPEASNIASKLSRLLSCYFDSTTILPALPGDEDEFPPVTTFINLVDLDRPIFQNISESTMEGLKCLLEVSRTVLWITSGARQDNAYHGASIGFGRSIAYELPHLSLQFLDLDEVGPKTPHVVAEALLRLVIAEDLKSKGFKSSTILWSIEPEYYVDRKKLLVPRVISDDTKNARFNAARRTIRNRVNPTSTPVVASPTEDGRLVLQENTSVLQDTDAESIFSMKLSTTIAQAIVSDELYYLGIGENLAFGTTAITLSTSIGSVIKASAHIPCSGAFPMTPEFLAAVAARVLAESLLSRISSKHHVLIFESSTSGLLRSTMAMIAEEKGLTMTLVTIVSGGHGSNWTQVDSLMSSDVINGKIPKNVTYFIDLSDTRETKEMALELRKHLPRSCREIHTAEFIRRGIVSSYEDDHRAAENALRSAVAAVNTAALERVDAKVMPVRAEQLTDHVIPTSVLTIIDWKSDHLLTVQAKPLDTTQMLSCDKTYVLVGLTGDLGKSLAEWMSENGAGHIVLASRNPKPDDSWIALMNSKGTSVILSKMDVTDRSDLARAVSEIRKTCPPIAGVINGAAFFRDILFSDMPYETMRDSLRPKIDGTRNLDELFDHSANLDFFIVTSSLTSIIGNPGQTNYTAANAYMTTLMAQRRKRGLPGTSIDIGRIAGIGHMAQEGGDLATEQLIRYGFMAISEPDFHYLFAEAIHCNRAGSNNGAQLVTGMRTVEDNEDPQVAWFDDPRFSHKVIAVQSDRTKTHGQVSTLSMQEKLAESANDQEGLEILKDGFASKLARIARLAEDQMKHDVPLLEFGIDSLAAVEIRGWFLKELKTDMPVVKILGGSNITDLAREAIERGAREQTSGSSKDSNFPQARRTPSVAADSSAPQSSVVTDVRTSPQSSTGTPASEVDESYVKDTSSNLVSMNSSSRRGLLPSAVNQKFLKAGESSLKAAESHDSLKETFVKSELLSFAQSRFWFLNHWVQDPTTFNVTFYYHIMGELRVGDFERAVRVVCNRHESLRTCFIADENDPDLAYQHVLPKSLVRVGRKNINSVGEVDAVYNEMRVVPFELSSGPLLRLILLTLSPSEHFLLVNYHHILMDGVSLQNFLFDLEKAYKRQHLGLQPMQLPEFSKKQRAAFKTGLMQDDIDFWKQQFPHGHPVLPLLPMAVVNSRKPLATFDVFQVERRLDAELLSKVKQTAKANASTAFHVYLSTFRTMLFRFTDAEDLTIGIADANRTESEIERSIGLLLNLITLRFTNKGEQPFDEVIADSRKKTFDALAHSRVPFDVLLQELGASRSSSYSPFFQAFFDYRQGHAEKQTFGNTTWDFKNLHPGRTAYDMTLDITDSADGALILFRVQTSLYDKTGAGLLADTFVHLLKTFVSDTSQAVQDPPLFGQEQLRGATDVGRGWDLVSSWPETLPHRIDQIASSNADKIALKDGHGQVLRYSDMTSRIQAIAELLLTMGLTKGDKILVFQDATADWPCSMLAIMRIGAVYVPLDLRNPLPRLADVAFSCRPAAILVDDTTVKNAPALNCTQAQIINISYAGTRPNTDVENVSRGDETAAILYTSGSTGKPKGILVRHSGLRNEIEGYTIQWKLKAEYTLQQSAFTFNHSSDQIYTALVNGGTCYIVPWSKRGDPIEITKLMLQEGVTYTKATPAEYSLWLEFGHDSLERLSTWRFAFGGGESLTETLVKKFARLNLPDLRFFNSYGPTEISISSTKMEINYRESVLPGRIPCGYSLPNYVAYVLDEKLQCVPTGMPGELWIGGAGVSLGYLNDERLTDYHFVDDPYASPEYVARGWTKMYRTGDIAHLNEDGAMVFRSRVSGDSQVKIRGLRIELEDIESNIVAASQGVLREAAVSLRDGEPQFLVAHVVFSPKNDVNDREAYLDTLLAHLEVPQYMIPAMAIQLEKMPLNNHNKIDRKALKELPLPQGTKNSEEVGEMTETMVQLGRLWEDVLGARELAARIGSATNFFSIGGNSLLIVRLQSQIRKTFNISVPLVQLISTNILKNMAKLIEESQSVNEINWEKEMDISDVKPAPIAVQSPKLTKSQKEVLITGAGGFLGKHILAELIKDPFIAKVHCIGLREKEKGQSRKLDVSSEKIVRYSGDLSAPRFGLSDAEFSGLAESIDSILHMGAVRSFWDNYHLLRPSNVASTKQIVRLASIRKVPIHYISSAGVIPEKLEKKTAMSVAQFLPPTDGSDGYIATRWVCEQILDRANKDFGIPVSIHRFISASEPDIASVGSAMDHFLEFVDRIPALPDFRGVRGHFEMTRVAHVALYLAKQLEVSLEAERSSPNFHNYECDIRIDIEQMNEFLHSSRSGESLPLIPGLKFIGRMKALGLQYFVTSQNLLMGQFDGNSGEDGVLLESKR